MSVVIRLFLIINLIRAGLGFNFDTKHPIVYNDPFLTGNNYFGYSLSLYPGNLNNAWIQIGSPQSSYPNRNGAIFKCQIYGPCVEKQVDSRHAESVERKEGGWLGNAMDIDVKNNRDVICSCKWTRVRYGNYYQPGKCFWSNLDANYNKLLPLDNKSKLIKSHAYYYAYGEAGFSAQFSRNKNASELLLGAPGVLNWRGAVLIYRDEDASLPEVSRLTSKKVTKRSVDTVAFDNLIVADQIDHAYAFALTGYSLTSGYYFNRNVLWYVAGAPRESQVGKVMIFQFSSHAEASIKMKMSKQGTQIGEYFGASLASGDINNDGFDDLIVGAPYYKKENYDEGRIYVFYGGIEGGALTNDFKIEGQTSGGQFGKTISFLDDIDMNGFPEVAVAAPFENDNSGVVYIFRCNSKGIELEPSQRLIGKNVGPNVKGFGISISKSQDIDGNNYKDIAVGAFKSSQVVLFRSRPTVILKQSIKLQNGAREIKVSDKEFELTFCLFYNGLYLPPTIKVKRTLIVDEMLQRAHLSKGFNTTEEVVLTERREYCRRFNITLKQNIDNFYDPINVKLYHELIDDDVNNPKEIINITNGKYTKIDPFCKECPIYDKYRSLKFHSMDVPFVLGCGDDNFCTSKLVIFAEFPNLEKSRYVVGSMKYMKFNVTIENLGENAYFTRFQVQLPEGINFRSVPSSCEERNSSRVILCNVDNPLAQNSRKTVSLDLDMKEINSGSVRKDTIFFNVTALTISVNENANTQMFPLFLVTEADINIIGNSGKQSYYINITHGTANFTQLFKIQKYGASPLDIVEITFKIPTVIKQRNFLKLYQPEGTHADQPINCISDFEYFLDNNRFENYEAVEDFDEKTVATISKTKYETPKRRKREAASSSSLVKNNEGENYPTNRTFYLNCSDPEVTCSTVVCATGPYRDRQNVANVILRMVFNSSAITDLLKLKDIIVVGTEGSVLIKSPNNYEQVGDRPDYVTVRSIFIGEIVAKKIAVWIIILSIILGLLLMLLLVIALIKAGFFKRAKKEELQALKEAEQAHTDVNADNTVEEKEPHEELEEGEDNMHQSIELN